jgi:hypothetical protein
MWAERQMKNYLWKTFSELPDAELLEHLTADN